MQLEYSAPQSVSDAIESVGRTEDVRFSPNNRRVALAGFARNRIAVFGVEITTSANGTQVALSGAIELSSPALKRPHGLDFIDDETLIVANREGDVAIFKLPADEPGGRSYDLAPIQTWEAGDLNLFTSPGSVAVARVQQDQCEILVCNNYGHTIIKHEVDPTAGYALRNSRVLLRKWLRVPDGVTLSHNRRWTAISNHETHSVFLYEDTPSLDEFADPDGVLGGLDYPHGLRFSADGSYLLVADAGAPRVHIYRQDGGDWYGVHRPASTITIMDDRQFARGNINPQEGGPKGLDISADSSVLVVTSDQQPLAFFDLPTLLEGESALVARPNRATGAAADRALSQREQQALDVSRELVLADLEYRAGAAEARVAHMTASMSWRLTAPLRHLRATWLGLRKS